MISIIKTGQTVDEAVDLALKELKAKKEDCEIEILEEPKIGIFGLIGKREAMVKVSLKDENLVKEIFSEKKEEAVEKEEEEKIVSEEDEYKTEEEKEDSDLGEKDRSEEVKIREKEREEVLRRSARPEEELDERAFDSSQDGDYLKDLDTSDAEGFLTGLIRLMGIDGAYVESSEIEGNVTLEIKGTSSKDTGILIGKRGDTLDAIQYITGLCINRNTEDYHRYFVDINDYRKRREESLINLAQKMCYKAKKYKKPMRLEPMNPYERRIIHTACSKISGIRTYSDGVDPYRRVIIKAE